VTRFPYLVFYVVGDEVVDVWRILHTLISTQPAATSSVSGAAGR